jgi:hypothetical protein
MDVRLEVRCAGESSNLLELASSFRRFWREKMSKIYRASERTKNKQQHDPSPTFFSKINFNLHTSSLE